MCVCVCVQMHMGVCAHVCVCSHVITVSCPHQCQLYTCSSAAAAGATADHTVDLRARRTWTPACSCMRTCSCRSARVPMDSAAGYIQLNLLLHIRATLESLKLAQLQQVRESEDIDGQMEIQIYLRNCQINIHPYIQPSSLAKVRACMHPANCPTATS